jgi:hypothetical protein
VTTQPLAVEVPSMLYVTARLLFEDLGTFTLCVHGTDAGSGKAEIIWSRAIKFTVTSNEFAGAKYESPAWLSKNTQVPAEAA